MKNLLTILKSEDTQLAIAFTGLFLAVTLLFSYLFFTISIYRDINTMLIDSLMPLIFGMLTVLMSIYIVQEIKRELKK
jgi:asparagine N-glycosylation enzyme membrane subunit Stt3